MGDRIAGIAAGMVMAALVLTLLVVVAGAFLVLLIIFLLIHAVMNSGEKEEAAEEVPVQAVGLFGAPATNWWLDRYDYWLFRLEEALHINFIQTPARLFAGSMILAGISGGLLAGAGYLLIGPQAVLPILIVAVLGNGLSAWWLGRPLTAMFEPLFNGGGDPVKPAPPEGIVIGDPLD